MAMALPRLGSVSLEFSPEAYPGITSSTNAKIRFKQCTAKICEAVNAMTLELAEPTDMALERRALAGKWRRYVEPMVGAEKRRAHRHIGCALCAGDPEHLRDTDAWITITYLCEKLKDNAVTVAQHRFGLNVSATDIEIACDALARWIPQLPCASFLLGEVEEEDEEVTGRPIEAELLCASQVATPCHVSGCGAAAGDDPYDLDDDDERMSSDSSDSEDEHVDESLDYESLPEAAEHGAVSFPKPSSASDDEYCEGCTSEVDEGELEHKEEVDVRQSCLGSWTLEMVAVLQRKLSELGLSLEGTLDDLVQRLGKAALADSRRSMATSVSTSHDGTALEAPAKRAKGEDQRSRSSCFTVLASRKPLATLVNVDANTQLESWSGGKRRPGEKYIEADLAT